MKNPLLIEIGTEELPVHSVPLIREHVPNRIAHALSQHGLIEEKDKMAWTCFTTPRRISFCIQSVHSSVTLPPHIQKIMPSEIGWDTEKKPTPALKKRIEKMNPQPCLSDIEVIFLEHEGKEWLVWKKPSSTKNLEAVLPAVLEQALHQIPNLNEMRWSNHEITFIRPLRNLLVIHGNQPLLLTAWHLTAKQTTLGHRTLAPSELFIEETSHYEEIMEKTGFVVVSNEKRQKMIRDQIEKIANDEKLDSPMTDPLNEQTVLEIAEMVEYPKSYAGHFPEEFLSLPPECLELTMRSQQKYITLRDALGKLSNTFIFVANNAPPNPQKIIQGNERVLKARLADAQFFYQQDIKNNLLHYSQQLSTVLYHEKLGSQKDRTKRLCQLVDDLGRLGQRTNEEIKQLKEAASLSKADLVTKMVQEFPELQGIMGGHYAQHEQKDPAVSEAISCQYKSHFSQQGKENIVSIYLNVAEKLETLLGLFSVNEKPTGEKDPFALRRKALCVVKAYLADDRLPPLSEALKMASKVYSKLIKNNPSCLSELSEFIIERAKNYAVQVLHYEKRIVDCLIEKDIDAIAPLMEKQKKLMTLLSRPQSKLLIETRKRIENILKNKDVSTPFRPALILQTEEKQLWEELERIKKPTSDAEYPLDELAKRVSDFFNGVLVHDSNQAIQKNRLALLNEVRCLFDREYALHKL